MSNKFGLSKGLIEAALGVMKGEVKQPEIETTQEIKEDVEQIDEISKKTLGSYIKAASKENDYNIANSGSLHRAKKDTNYEKRKAGINKAVDKLTKEEALDTEDEAILESITEEEIEQLDEISKATLGSYVKKASRQAAQSQSYQTRADIDGDHEASSREMKFRWKRNAGINKAVDKLTKENVEFSEEELAWIEENLSEEQINEVSKETLQSYVKKAKADPSFEKGKGRPSASKIKTQAKRTSGLETAKAKLGKIADKEYAEHKAHHAELIKHVRDNAHDVLTSHGYHKLGGDEHHSLYMKHIPGTAVANHAIVHHNNELSGSHVVTLKSTTGWQDSSNDRHDVSAYAKHHSQDFGSFSSGPNTKHGAIKHLSTAIEKHDNYHAEKAKDPYVYR